MLQISLLLVAIALCVEATPIEAHNRWRPSARTGSTRHATRRSLIGTHDHRKVQKRWTQTLRARGLKASFGAFEAVTAPATLRVLDDSVQLTTATGTGSVSRLIQQLNQEDEATPRNSSNPGFGFAEVQNIQNTVYLMPIYYGGEQYLSVIDTGSSDTWLVGEGYKCIKPDGSQLEIAPSACNFAKPYRKTATYKEMPDRHFNIKYIDGEFLNGTMATETVTLGQVTVEDQEIGVIEYASWMGDSMSSGLIGLAFPSVTKGFKGPFTPESRTKYETVPYNPIFTSMWKKGLVSPIFSIALNRANEPPGLITLGGIPGSPMRYASEWAVAPLEYLHINGAPVNLGEAGAGEPVDFQLYLVTVDGFTVQPAKRTLSSLWAPKARVSMNKQQVVIDSGTTVSYLPKDVSERINRAWSPAAKYDAKSKMYKVSCQAKPPKAGLMLDGKTIWFGGPDLIVPFGKECISGVQTAESAGGLAILGGVFLKNVVAVFDIGAAQMRFASRIR